MPSPAAFLLESVFRQAETCVDRCLSNWKIGFAAMLFVEGLVFGHVVYLVKRLTVSSSKTYSYVFHVGNALSGGFFFAAGVLHILPEAIELISGEHGEEDHEDDHEGPEERWMSLRQEIEEEPHNEAEEDEHGSEVFPWAFLVLMISFYFFFFIEQILLPKLLSKSSKLEEPDEEGGQLNDDHDENGLSDIVTETKGFRSKEFFTGLMEILGISAHSLFESIALGLSGSFSTVLNIFIATASHRWATTAAIGFKLLKSLNYIPFLTLLLLFSAIVPIGIGIGAALGNLSQTVQGVLFAISAGTFIYIGVYDVLSEEFAEHRKWPLTKFAATLAGAAMITVVTVILHVLDVHG